MHVPLIVEQTQTITVDNGLVLVSSLPSELRCEIATLDAYAQAHRTALFELEKTNLLVEGKKQQVQKLLKDHFEIQNRVKSTGAAVEGDTAPDSA